MSAYNALRAAVAACRAIARRVDANPLQWMLWLPLQFRYLQCIERFRLIRAGNQALGKTTVAVADLLLHALGDHPFRRCEVAGEYWIICASWSQSIGIQGKLHALLSPGRCKPGTQFTPSRGFRGKNPTVEVRHRSGRYSIIRFKTTQQGTLNLAGATILGALFDEVPATQGIYSEVVKRVMASGGWVSIGMTPVGAPVEWIRKETEADPPRIIDIHARLTPDQLIPVGRSEPRRIDGKPCDAAWIAQIEAETPEVEREVRVHGGWEFRTKGNYFDGAWNPLRLVHAHAPTGTVKVVLGIDHGFGRVGKQCAVLLAVDDSVDPPNVYALDEYTDVTGVASPADDAAGILKMLARNGLKWGDLDFVHGDRVHMPGTGAQKSNRDLAAQIARLLKVALELLKPFIRTVKRGQGHGAGSLTVGSRWLFHAMVAGRFAVHPRCTKLIECLPKYTFADDGNKDIIDAVRYALDPWIFRVQFRGGGAPVLRTW